MATQQIHKSKRKADPFKTKTGKDRLKALFPSQAKFDMFEAALQRENQLFQQSNKILAGSPTARRQAGIEAFDEGESAVNAFVGNSITGGWVNSLMNMAATLATKSDISDEVAAKVAKLLSSSKPEEVAAAVKILERNAAKAQQSVKALNKGETGAIMGTMTAFPPSPIDPNAKPEDIEADMDKEQESFYPGFLMMGPNIEDDIAADIAAEEKMK
jgi:acyl-coenzyme A thioesterase PaaI-like protein